MLLWVFERRGLGVVEERVLIHFLAQYLDVHTIHPESNQGFVFSEGRFRHQFRYCGFATKLEYDTPMVFCHWDFSKRLKMVEISAVFAPKTSQEWRGWGDLGPILSQSTVTAVFIRDFCIIMWIFSGTASKSILNCYKNKDSAPQAKILKFYWS